MKIQTQLVVIWIASLILVTITAQPSRADLKGKTLFPPWEYKVVPLDGDEQENARKLNELAAEGWEYVGPLGKGQAQLRRSLIGGPSDALTAAGIKALFEKSNEQPVGKIEGSDNDDNQIPPGTILLYVTNENRYGYLDILEYGYNLSIKWVTFDKTGGVFAKGDRLLIKGTWNYDLDYGVEGDKGKSRIDFWWEQVDKTRRYWVFQNGAKFLVYSPKTHVLPKAGS